MKFSRVEIGKRWFCPWCGQRRLSIVDSTIAGCTNQHCRRIFQVYIIALPDPNGKTGNKECGNKFKHETLDSAFRHADELKELPFRARKDLLIYRCRFCDKYHVGHKAKIERKRLNELYRYKATTKRSGGWAGPRLKANHSERTCRQKRKAEGMTKLTNEELLTKYLAELAGDFTDTDDRDAYHAEILNRMDAGSASPLEVALRKIADNYGGCHCDHTNADCCEKAGEFCPHCISEIALSTISSGSASPHPPNCAALWGTAGDWHRCTLPIGHTGMHYCGDLMNGGSTCGNTVEGAVADPVDEIVPLELIEAAADNAVRLHEKLAEGAAGEASPWSLIEAAPKTGEHILAADFTAGKVGFGGNPQQPYQCVVHWFEWSDGTHQEESGWYPSTGAGDNDALTNLTHYKPLDLALTGSASTAGPRPRCPKCEGTDLILSRMGSTFQVDCRNENCGKHWEIVDEYPTQLNRLSQFFAAAPAEDTKEKMKRLKTFLMSVGATLVICNAVIFATLHGSLKSHGIAQIVQMLIGGIMFLLGTFLPNHERTQ